MTVSTVVALLFLALFVGAIGFALGIMVAPAIGGWAERIGDDERSAADRAVSMRMTRGNHDDQP